MTAKAIWRKLRWSIRQRGYSGTLRVGLRGLLRRRSTAPLPVHPFDRQHGTNTGGVIGGGSLAIGSKNDAHITAYAGIAPSRLRSALERWEASLPAGEEVSEFTFVDLGCGKGRAMLLASERPFQRAVGIELNPELVAIAQSNILVFGKSEKMQTRLEVRQGDASELVYPPGPLLVFIYNSFGLPVVQAVLDALELHARSTGARVDLLFQNEGPEMPMRSDARLQSLWTGSLALSGEDAAADPVASAEDVTSLYRWVG